ncbi:MAG TPA: TetR/AcrR family transcriptional regulator [Rhizomicrobium sp.]|nr:TetR/AcrR family transcriptional regulator [Rhizomicrobium sp.]
MSGRKPARKSAKLLGRRKPKQQRSVETIEAIFEATARILESAEATELTTIRIAELSGYGVGTIYDYFSNKEEILVAMARSELEKTFRSVQRIMTAGLQRGDESMTRLAIRATIRGFGGRQRLRRILLETMIAQGHSAELAQPVERIAQHLVGNEIGEAGTSMRRLRPESLYVLTRAVIGVIRASVMEGNTKFSQQLLENELTDLTEAYVRRCLAGT